MHRSIYKKSPRQKVKTGGEYKEKVDFEIPPFYFAFDNFFIFIFCISAFCSSNDICK